MPVNPYYQSRQEQTAATRYKSETARRAAEVGARVPTDHHLEDEDEISYETVLGSQFLKSKKQIEQDDVLFMKVVELYKKGVENGVDLDGSADASSFTASSVHIGFFAEAVKLLQQDGLADPVGYYRWIRSMPRAGRIEPNARLALLLLTIIGELEDEIQD